MVRMVRSLADRTFQLSPNRPQAPGRARRGPPGSGAATRAATVVWPPPGPRAPPGDAALHHHVETFKFLWEHELRKLLRKTSQKSLMSPRDDRSRDVEGR